MGRRGRKPKIKVEDLEVKTHYTLGFKVPIAQKKNFEQLFSEIEELCARLDLPKRKWIILLNALELYKKHLQQQLEERLTVEEKKEEIEQVPQVEEKKEETITFADILNYFTKSEQKYISLIEETEDYIRIRLGYIRDKRLWSNIHNTLVKVIGAEYQGSGIYEIPKSKEEREKLIEEAEEKELMRKAEKMRQLYEAERRAEGITSVREMIKPVEIEEKKEESYFDRLGKQYLQELNCQYAKSIRYDERTWSYRVYCDYLKKEVDLDYCRRSCTIRGR